MNSDAPAEQGRTLYDRKHAADFLGVSERQLDTWIKQKRINVTRLGRLVRVHEDELQRIAVEGIVSR